LPSDIQQPAATDRVRGPGAVFLAAMRIAALVALPALAAAALPAAGSAASPGQLYAFGGNYHGELGDETNNYDNEPNPTPAPVTLPGEVGPVTQAAAGSNFSLAVTAGGQLYAFGSNWKGQLGNETNIGVLFSTNPTPALVTLPGEVGPVTQAAAGKNVSLAITASGQLYAFGDNSYGQLGTTTNYKREVPNPTPTLVTLPGASGAVTQVAAGGFHSLALTASGQLYAFGDNESGQLGNEIKVGDLSANPTPTLVTLPGANGPVTQIAAGGLFSLAVTAGGQLYAFGENYSGQLGNPTNNGNAEYPKNSTPTLVTLPGEVGPVTQAAAGNEHSLALTASGQLYAFGENHFGQLGNPTNNRTPNPNPTPALVRLPGARGAIVRIAAGSAYSLALTSTGQLYAFGSDFYGELGTPPGEERGTPHPTPRQVALPGANVETVATGCLSGQTLVVLADLAVTSALPAGESDVPYSARAQGTGGAAPYTWSASGLPPGLSIDPEDGAISGTPTTAGTYTPTITATDSDGIEAPTPLTLRVKGSDESPPSEPPPPGESLPAPPTEQPPPSIPPLPTLPQQPLPQASATPPPSVQHARQSAKRWHEGNPLSHRGRAKLPAGTTFSFSLNEPATVSLDFIQPPEGGRIAHGCLATAHANTQRSSCGHTISRVVTRGTLSLAGHRGVNDMVFAGRISRTDKLEPGHYELIITADAAGQHSAPASLSFTIAK
jgi:alpha-tubulin suppressor-like RCC1 family protein